MPEIKAGKDDRKGKGRGRGDAEGRQRRREDEFFAKDKGDKRMMIIDAASGRHNILTNCLNCGKIVAESEGRGPCLFCGSPLEVDDAYGIRIGDDRGYIVSVGLVESSHKFNASFQQAKDTKDRLLKYDRNNKENTFVIDDAADWYSESLNPWNNIKQKEEASRLGAAEEHLKKEEMRRQHVTLDFFGRTVIDNSAKVKAELGKKGKENFAAFQDRIQDENKLLRMFESSQKGMQGSKSQLSGESQQLYERLRASLHESRKNIGKGATSKFGFAQQSADDEDLLDKKKNARWDASTDKDRVENEFTHVSASSFLTAARGEEGSQKLLPVEKAEGDLAPSARAKAALKARPPSPRTFLDLWPAQASEEILQVVGKEKDVADGDVVVLQDGFVRLVGFVPADIQQQIIDVMRELGVSETGFAPELYDGIDMSKDVSRMYLGKHYNPQTQRWDNVREAFDGKPPAAIPEFFLTIYKSAVQRANGELRRGPNKKRKMHPFPEGCTPNIGIAKFFESSGTMQIHQDRQESKESIAAGYPVMGICIGESCDFPYGTEQPTAAQKPKTVRLESGDVYLFGGASRMLWHGVTKVIPRSAPPSLRLIPGHLSVTLRVA